MHLEITICFLKIHNLLKKSPLTAIISFCVEVVCSKTAIYKKC